MRSRSLLFSLVVCGGAAVACGGQNDDSGLYGGTGGSANTGGSGNTSGSGGAAVGGSSAGGGAPSGGAPSGGAPSGGANSGGSGNLSGTGGAGNAGGMGGSNSGGSGNVGGGVGGGSSGGSGNVGGTGTGGSGAMGGFPFGGSGGTSTGGSGAMGGFPFGGFGGSMGGTGGVGGFPFGGTGGAGATGGAGGTGGTGGTVGVGKIACGTSSCDAATAYCCQNWTGSSYKGSCQPDWQSCYGTNVNCDGPEDCKTGEVCCGNLVQSSQGTYYTDFTCKAAGSCNFAGSRIVCGNTPTACPTGLTCKNSAVLPQYKVCGS